MVNALPLTWNESKPLIDKNGEVPELGDEFFNSAKRGRPAMAENERKQRVTLYLDKAC